MGLGIPRPQQKTFAGALGPGALNLVFTRFLTFCTERIPTEKKKKN